MEHLATGTVKGELLGFPGNGRQITFRMIHIWEFRDGLICRENVSLDGGSIAAQLASPNPATDGVKAQHFVVS
jgi:predicted ester cyclase